MNYLLDRKNKRRKYWGIAFLIVFLAVFFYFRAGIFNKLSYASHIVFRPALSLGGSFGGKIARFGAYFADKDSLQLENERLSFELGAANARIANYDSIAAENDSLKEILGRKKEGSNFVMAAILAKPSHSPYDTLIIDAGTMQGIEVGGTVFAYGDVPIGRVAEVSSVSSKVVLFSNAGEKTQVMIGEANVSMEIVGRGGGNFEMATPLDFKVQKGDQALLPGIDSYVLGVVESIISDPRDSFQKALLVSPVNIQELKFVEVKR